MTPFEFFVPLIALALALAVGCGLALYIRHAAKRLDAQHKTHHPAE